MQNKDLYRITNDTYDKHSLCLLKASVNAAEKFDLGMFVNQ